MDDLKIEEMDLYELFEIDPSSSTADIKKAYRKKALQCHPDKNPDDPEAARKFHQLSKILEVLTDDSARAAYDKVLKGKKEAAIRHQELDSKRRKLKEDLEERERRAAAGKGKDADDQQTLRKEIERLRKEGSLLVQEEVQNVLNELKKKATQSQTGCCRIKIKWEVKKNDSNNGGYNKDMLIRFLSKYGDIEGIVMSPKKNGSALVEFKDPKAGQMAIDYEVGLPQNPLKFEWISGGPKRSEASSLLVKNSDFESVTLTKLRQAEERKRLIAQMMAEEEDS
ncbi:hypothetical protein GWI33_023030 [Rhynchophorus ferrugineus]|uniref:J domain-containing protein n=1 Tax=Rhynchophorus ferrugineus TaxID=354439 RepID=A0A834LY57_RHYFE|nr:hypothetical protein GWI33_023030 [Rhynchophorus ferrugineus]